MNSAHPYAQLTPDRVLDALSRVGIRGDGRLLALGSYENRVYQAWRDDGPPVDQRFALVRHLTIQRWRAVSTVCLGEEIARVPIVFLV